jgi:hypothetical protein
MARAKSAIMRFEGQPVKAMLSTDGIVVLGHNGKLRLYDPPYHVCHGKGNGCRCNRCEKPSKEATVSKWTKTQSLPSINTAPKRCECEKPVNNEGTCLSCGKPISSLRQAA